MTTDVFVGLVLILGAAIALVLMALAKAAAKTPPAPPARIFYQCGQRACTARATHIVLMSSAPTESRVVCWEDCQRLVRLGHAVNLGPIARGR